MHIVKIYEVIDSAQILINPYMCF